MNYEKLKAIFYLDTQWIKRLEWTREDILLTVPGASNLGYQCREMSIFDIFSIFRDTFENIKDTGVVKGTNLNISELYQRANDLSWDLGVELCPLDHKPQVPYHIHINYIYCFNFEDPDDNWFDKDEIDEFVQAGYSGQTLQLQNHLINRDYYAAERLLKQGVSIKGDPDDNELDSYWVLDSLKTEDSVGFNELIEHLSTPANELNIGDAIASLYKTASSASMLNLLLKYGIDIYPDMKDKT